MKTKRQIAANAYQVTTLSKVTTILEIVSIIMIVLSSTIGWLWMDWAMIWKVVLSAFVLLIIGVLIDYAGVRLIMNHFKSEIDEMAKNTESGNRGYSGYFEERLQKLADKKNKQK